MRIPRDVHRKDFANHLIRRWDFLQLRRSAATLFFGLSRLYGMGGVTQQSADQGQQAHASPDQVQQGLSGTGLIDKVAAKAGVSPEVAKVALATILPIVIAHFTSNGQQSPPQSGFGGMLPAILNKLTHDPTPTQEKQVADFQQLQQKYAPVVDEIKKFEPYGAKFVGSEFVGEHYHLVAHVPSQVVLNRVWDAIKQVDPPYADLKHEITNTGGQEVHYTLQSGETLSKVRQLYYGSASKYEAIAKASGMSDPNKAQAGQNLTIPVQ